MVGVSAGESRADGVSYISEQARREGRDHSLLTPRRTRLSTTRVDGDTWPSADALSCHDLCRTARLCGSPEEGRPATGCSVVYLAAGFLAVVFFLAVDFFLGGSWRGEAVVVFAVAWGTDFILPRFAVGLRVRAAWPR